MDRARHLAPAGDMCVGMNPGRRRVTLAIFRGLGTLGDQQTHACALGYRVVWTNNKWFQYLNKDSKV